MGSVERRFDLLRVTVTASTKHTESTVKGKIAGLLAGFGGVIAGQKLMAELVPSVKLPLSALSDERRCDTG